MRVLPIPSWPCVFVPQQTTESSASMAQVSSVPSESDFAPFSAGTFTGVLELVVVPSQNAPFELSPQQATVPSDMMAHV